MYSKVFSQIFTSSIADNYVIRHVFMDLLVLADKNGVVDMTPRSISGTTNVPQDIVEFAITKLEAPDPESRNQEAQGRRLLRLDDHRSWGWKIVNFKHYNEMRNNEARREYFRLQKQAQRERLSRTDGGHGGPSVDSVSVVADVGAGVDSAFELNKSKDEIEIPEWIPQEVWDGYVEMRNSLKPKPTQRALKLVISRLQTFKDEGFDPVEILNTSVMNSWKGLFKPEGAKKNGNTSTAKVGGNIAAANDAYRILRRGDSEGAAGTKLRSLGPGRP